MFTENNIRMNCPLDKQTKQAESAINCNTEATWSSNSITKLSFGHTIKYGNYLVTSHPTWVNIADSSTSHSIGTSWRFYSALLLEIPMHLAIRQPSIPSEHLRFLNSRKLLYRSTGVRFQLGGDHLNSLYPSFYQAHLGLTVENPLPDYFNSQLARIRAWKWLAIIKKFYHFPQCHNNF